MMAPWMIGYLIKPMFGKFWLDFVSHYFVLTGIIQSYPIHGAEPFSSTRTSMRQKPYRQWQCQRQSRRQSHALLQCGFGQSVDHAIIVMFDGRHVDTQKYV